MRKSVHILGASGRFGRHAADAFWHAGWGVRPLDRQRDDLDRAAADCDVIIAAWNPLYPDWAAQVPQLHARIQKAAKASAATVIVPANIYVFGPDAPPPWRADTPHTARNPLGRIRIEMEQSYRNSGVKTILLRAGDFIDTEASGNWLDKVILSKLSKGKFIYPGRLDAPHAWAYLPDLAQAAVHLAEIRDTLKTFEDVPFAGYTLTGHTFATALEKALVQTLTIKSMPWWTLKAARPFWPMARHLLEMRYLWGLPHQLDDTRLHQLCPNYRGTALDEALANAIAPLLAKPKTRIPFHCNSTSTQTIR
jgi:nucleoside-diphosphate-sugar epimerase